MMRRLPIAVLLLAAMPAPAPAQDFRLPSEKERDRCVEEERQRDRLALRRFGQRTRGDQELRALCEAEVRRGFDDRVLDRAPRPGPPPIGFQDFGGLPGFGGPRPTSRGAGETLSITGAWWLIGTEVQADNRYVYFAETDRIERRGSEAIGWLAAYYERGYPNGMANTAYRVRVDCPTGRFRYDRVAFRDRGLRVLREDAPDRDWREPATDPMSPVVKLTRALCASEEPGTRIPAEQPPADAARAWLAANPPPNRP